LGWGKQINNESEEDRYTPWVSVVFSAETAGGLCRKVMGDGAKRYRFGGWEEEMDFIPSRRCLTLGCVTESLKRGDEAVIRGEAEKTGRTVLDQSKPSPSHGTKMIKQLYLHCTESITAISWTLMDAHSKRSKNKGKLVIL